MNSSLPRLFLASQSPRRKQILESLGIGFTVIEPGGVEQMPGAHEINEITRLNSLTKAQSILSHLDRDTDVAIGSDTLVVLENEVMGKPKDSADAMRMLKALSGRWHVVVTGLALVSRKHGELQMHDISRIKFRSLSSEEIRSYVGTREPHDKAGSYAVQGLGALFIEKIEGSYTNVMGFPLEKFLVNLSAFTHIPLNQWFL